MPGQFQFWTNKSRPHTQIVSFRCGFNASPLPNATESVAWQGMCSMQAFLGFSPRFDMRKILLGFFVCFCDISSTATTSACLHASRSFQFCGLRSNCDLAIYQPPMLPTWHTEIHMCLLNSVPYLWGQHQSPRALEASLASAVGSRFDICLRVKADR